MKVLKKGYVSVCMIFLLAAAAATIFLCKDTTVCQEEFGMIWSAPSTVKILQSDIDYEDKGEAALSYNMVKNEYESMQLIVTATEEVSSYYLEISDLTCGDQVLPAENITVYNQRYIPVTETYYFNNETTYVPDALIPLDTAKEYGELTIAAGNNGGLWITVYASADQAPGTYTGTFLLTVNGIKTEIPVTVVVNDYTIPEETTMVTSFSWKFNLMGTGELDSSNEMINLYYSFFLDYGISLLPLPLESLTGEELIACLEEYYDSLTTFCITKEVGTNPGSISYGADVVKEQILAMAACSTAERNYFEKVIIYTKDEPDFTSDYYKDSFITEMYACIALLTECADEIQADTTGVYDAFKEIEGWRDYVINIPRVTPTTNKGMTWIFENLGSEEVDEVLKSMNCICPVYSCFTENWLERIYDLCEEYDLILWWYGCCDPKAPASTYHLGDTNLLSCRSISWLQKKYNVIGSLFWDAAGNTCYDTDTYNQYVNLYTNPYRQTGLPAGDGYLVYPGAAYGLTGPITSMRLMSTRDGIEEYAMVTALEAYYEKLKEGYGDAFDVDACMNYFYDKLYYDGYLMTADGEDGLDFTALRAELIEALLWMDNGLDFAFSYTEPYDSQSVVTVFAAEGVSVSVNGTTLVRNAEGYFTYDLNLWENTSLAFVLMAADGTVYEFSRFIGEPGSVLQAFDEEAALEAVTVTEGSSAALVQTTTYSDEGYSLKLSVHGVVTGNAITDATFVPTATLSLDCLKDFTKLTDYKKIRLTLYSADSDYSLTIKLCSGSSYVSLGTYEIGTGRNRFTIDVESLVFSKLDSVDAITFEFSNTNTEGEVMNYQLYLDCIEGWILK